MTGIRDAIEEITASVVAKPRVARDPVNEPTIKNWVEALGDRNPIYTDEAAARDAGHPGIVAPPAMIQVWTMFGLGGERPTDDPMGPMMELFDGAGYVGVVATNCEQTYHRYLQPGEQVSISSEMRDVVGPKQTALGEGWFINQHITWRVGDEDVAEMDWRILKFKPREAEAAGGLRRARGSGRRRDDAPCGVARHRVLLGRRQGARAARSSGGRTARLQHPPVPAVWQDKEKPIDYVVASGKGTVYSFVVHHAPEGAGPHAAVRHRSDRTRRRRTHARRAAQRRPRRGEDRNAGSRNVYRLPGR